MGRGRIQYREQEIEQMIMTLKRSSKELQETQQAMMAIAKRIEGGALLGTAGEMFCSSLQSTLSRQIEQLSDELIRQSKFVERELDQLRQAASSSRD
jgi:hypothetical protein